MGEIQNLSLKFSNVHKRVKVSLWMNKGAERREKEHMVLSQARDTRALKRFNQHKLSGRQNCYLFV